MSIKQRNFNQSRKDLVYDDPNSDCTLGLDVVGEESKQEMRELRRDLRPVKIPNLDEVDVQKLSVLKNKLKNMKHNNVESSFVDDLDSIMTFINDEVDESNKKEIVLFIMYKIENFVLKRHAGEIKKKLAVKVLKQLFNNDENVTNMVIDLCMYELSQVKLLGRIKRRVYNYFFSNR